MTVSPINIEDYTGLIVAQAIFFQPKSSDEREEFIQVGTVGALNAIKHYDPDKGKLSTYMTHCIRNAILKYMKKFRRKAGLVIENHLKDIPMEEGESLAEFLPELTSEEQQLIDHKLNGLSRQDIADAMEIPISLVTYRLKELYAKIRRSNEN